MDLYPIIESTEDAAAAIDDKIVAFNSTHVSFITPGIFQRHNFHITDQQGNMIAGVNALLYCWNIAYLDVLYVDSAYRGKGIGTQLMDHLEMKMQSLGSTLIHLDTFDWQAKDFYEKRGYSIFGVLDDCPERHKRYYLRKTLKNKLATSIGKDA